MRNINWENWDLIDSKKYTCGYCGNNIASNKGFMGLDNNKKSAYIYICHHCGCPTFFPFPIGQYPGAAFGKKVEHLPDDVNSLYDEARNCISCNAFTASTICCRKLLMNISVEKGAPEGESFQYYVGWLLDEGYISKAAKDWVDNIRTTGNDATHKIDIKTRDEAERLILFIENVLETLYEFPGKINTTSK